MLFILQGCAVLKEEVNVGLTRPVELTETPFYPQEKYQCGPASLAMVLGASGVQIHPDDLVSKIYLPGRKGSLQLELVAAARQYGRIPYVIDGTLPALIAEIADGRPVLVLQNLGIEVIPVYHYAVVIGVQPDNTFVLRSGTERRISMAADDFLETWQRSGSWGFVLLKPGELPVHPDPEKYLRTVSAFETVGNAEAATKAYTAAVTAWPGNQNALFALGNNYLRRQEYHQAENIFRKLLAMNPAHIGGLNNLAELLAGRGCYAQAQKIINTTVKLAESNNSPFKDVVLETQQEINEKIRQADQLNDPMCNDLP